MSSPRRGSPEDLRQKIHLDNMFRLALSLITFLVRAYLWMVHVIADSRPLFLLLIAYTVPYLLIWALSTLGKGLNLLDYVLSALDIGGITWCIHLSGGVESPFFYLYAIPLL